MTPKAGSFNSAVSPSPGVSPRWAGYGSGTGGGQSEQSVDLASLGSYGGSLYSTAPGLASARATTVDELLEALQQGGGAQQSTKMSGRRSMRDQIEKLGTNGVQMPYLFGAPRL